MLLLIKRKEPLPLRAQRARKQIFPAFGLQLLAVTTWHLMGQTILLLLRPLPLISSFWFQALFLFFFCLLLSSVFLLLLLLLSVQSFSYIFNLIRDLTGQSDP